MKYKKYKSLKEKIEQLRELEKKLQVNLCFLEEAQEGIEEPLFSNEDRSLYIIATKKLIKSEEISIIKCIQSIEKEIISLCGASYIKSKDND